MSNSPVPPELPRHEVSKFKPGNIYEPFVGVWVVQPV